jgi:hypothetical protein
MIVIPIHNYLLLLCLLIAILTFRRHKSTSAGLMIPYLLLTALVEATGLYLWKIIGLHSNSLVYNPYITLQGLFLIFIFLKTFQSTRLKHAAKIISIPFLMFSIVNITRFQGINRFNHYTILLLSFIIIILACAYYLDFLWSDNHGSIFKIPFFWINSGFFLFFLLMLFYWGTFEYLVARKIDYRGKVFLHINQIANFLLYLNISLGLLCKRQTP